MAEPVQVEVKSDLRKIIADLEALSAKADGVGEHLQRAGNETEKNLDKNTKNVETMLERVRDLGRRMADQLRGYFKDLATQTEHSLEDARKDLGLKKQFIEATKEAVSFNAVLHRIGTTLGLNSAELADFQRDATKAFASIGMDANAAARALSGVSETQVRGKENILKTATTGSELAELSGEKGNEGGVAKALATALQAQGKNPNDMKAMEELAENARRNFNNTGQKPSDYLSHTAAMYEGMSAEDRRKMSGEGMRNLSAVGAVVGPGFDSLVKEMTKGHLEKLPLEAQGLGGVIGKNGVDFDKLQRIKGIGQRIGGDQVAAFQTTGMSKEAATALVKLIEMADQAKAAQAKAGTDIAGGPKSIEEQAKQSRGLPENFEAAKNQVHGIIGAAEAPIVEGATKVVGKLSETKVGSAALIGGGFLAASAASYGLGKLAKMIGGKGGAAAEVADSMAAAKKAATVEQITGQKTMPVYVVNVAELASAIGSSNGLPGGGGAGMGGGLGGIGEGGTGWKGVANKGLKVLGAATTGVAIGEVANEIIDATTQGKSETTGVEGNIVERGFAVVKDVATGGELSKQYAKEKEEDKRAKAAQLAADSRAMALRDHQRHENNKSREQKNRDLLRAKASTNAKGTAAAPKVGN